MDPLYVNEFTSDEIKAAVEAATDFGTYVSVHSYTPHSVRRSIDAGVTVIEHGQLLDEATVKYMADKGIWLSTQVFDEAGPSFPPDVRARKHELVLNQGNVWRWAVKNNVKLAWGTDLLFEPQSMYMQNTELVEMKKFMTPAHALKIVTHDNAQLFALSGKRNPYPGKLGVVQEGAYADLLLVDGDPTVNLDIIADPQKNFRVIMKDGTIYKNTL
jgi:imidazolonepropionase-like amidohydrolase